MAEPVLPLQTVALEAWAAPLAVEHVSAAKMAPTRRHAAVLDGRTGTLTLRPLRFPSDAAAAAVDASAEPAPPTLIDVTAFDWLAGANDTAALVAVDSVGSVTFLHLEAETSSHAAAAAAAATGAASAAVAEMHAVTAFPGAVTTELPLARLRQLLKRRGLEPALATLRLLGAWRASAVFLLDGSILLTLSLAVRSMPVAHCPHCPCPSAHRRARPPAALGHAYSADVVRGA